MKTILKFALSLVIVVLVGATTSSAQKTYNVDDVPNVRLADKYAAVSDPDDILSQAARKQLNDIAIALQKVTSIEMAIVVLPSIGDSNVPEDFGVQLFEKWGIGKSGKDNGLLILLLTEDRVIRFEVGYGLEGVLTDAISGRIQRERMNPYLAKADWDRGLLEGVKAVEDVLTDPDSDLRNEPDSMEGTERDENILYPILIILFGMGLIVIIAVVAQRRANKCPKCGAQMKVVDTKSHVKAGVKSTTYTLRCPKCGHTKTRKSTTSASVAGGAIGGAMGGFGGGSRSGGGSFGGGGGSFGGGRSGGGGSTSRF